MAKTSRTFRVKELYENLGIFDLPPTDQHDFHDAIANWRVHYQTEDGRLGLDLVDYHDDKADLNMMAQQFLDQNRNAPNYWRYDKQKLKFDNDAEEIKRLLGQLFCQKNVNAAKLARRSLTVEENHGRSNVAVSDATQSREQSGETSSDSGSSGFANKNNCYNIARRPNLKRTPSIWMDGSTKRPKITQPQLKPNGVCSRCKRLHQKCDGAQECIKCIKAGADCVYDKLASRAGLDAKGDVTMHQTDSVPEAEPTALVSHPATPPVATTVPLPAATRTNRPSPAPTATLAPNSTRVDSSDWRSELLPQAETDTVQDLMHQREGTNTEGNSEHPSEKAHQEDTNTEGHNTDQTSKLKASTTFMVLTRIPRQKMMKTYWPEGSLSGKMLRDIFHEAEELVGRANTKEIKFELKGSQTGYRFRIHAGDQKAFEHMRKCFNHEAKDELKKGHYDFEISLELIGGTEQGDNQIDNEIDELSEVEEVF